MGLRGEDCPTYDDVVGWWWLSVCLRLQVTVPLVDSLSQKKVLDYMYLVRSQDISGDVYEGSLNSSRTRPPGH